MSDMRATVIDYLERAPDHSGIGLNRMMLHSITTNEVSVKPSSMDMVYDEDRPLKDGIPAVKSVSIMDNDFWDMQQEAWKNAYPELCTDKTMLRITEVLDSKVLNENTIRLQLRRLVVELG